jgi:hypothetical protein
MLEACQTRNLGVSSRRVSDLMNESDPCTEGSASPCKGLHSHAGVGPTTCPT